MYRNVMEILVEEKVEEMWKGKSGCRCNECREDVIALTLNHMPPQYVVSHEGELYTKMKHVDARSLFEITKQIAVAMNIITSSPRHFVQVQPQELESLPEGGEQEQQHFEQEFLPQEQEGQNSDGV